MASRGAENDIAVIGMACRMAGANSPSELWDILANSKDVQSVISRFNTEGFYHPQGGPRKGSTNVRHAYTMDDEAIDKFDHAFFHITPVEAMAIDPQQRMLLEVAYEAIENAGIPLEDFMGTDTSVMAGVESCDYHYVLSRDLDATPRYLATGTPMCMAANRISYSFNLSGPSIAMDTACSSTMAALHQAVRALQHGDSGMAVVCGAKLILTPDMFIPSTELGFLSPSGRCRSFDAEADGYGRGEGVTALLLKPLAAAIADGDPVRAVIKGTRLNQDGRTQGITLPSAAAQKDNMEKLYSELGISSADIQYLEAHGTGTAGGDRLEFSAIHSVFAHKERERPLVVGGLKSCIGHLEACAGLASVVKTIECLERGKIPPQMHFRKPNPEIDFRGVVVPLTMLDWPAYPNRIRRAAVNTFGAGGTNAHAVLESYDQRVISPQPTHKTCLFMVSAADGDTLRRMSLKYADYIERSKSALSDLAHTLLTRRSTLAKSIYFAADSHGAAVSKLRSQVLNIHCTRNKSIKALLFLFTGQGAQWPTMGKKLIEESPLFISVLRKCDEILASLPDRPSWSIITELNRAPDASNVYKTSYSQTLCTVLQLGLVILLKSWGILPTVVVGHSSGEIAAAYVGGYISFEHAIIVAYYRGMFLGRVALNNAEDLDGSMCAVGMNQSEALHILEQHDGKVQLAAVNSPTSCTLSGDTDAIKEIGSYCLQHRIFFRRLHVDMAYHSHHVVPSAAAYETALIKARVSYDGQRPSCDMFSSVTGQKLTPLEMTPRYWKDNMTSTVKFHSALTACLEGQPQDLAVLEIGPHPALKGPVTETLICKARKRNNYFHTLFRNKRDGEVLLENVGEMIAFGIPVQKGNINGVQIPNNLSCRHECPAVLKDLPSYQWDHSASLWYEARTSRNQRFRKFPRHQILGSRYLEDSPRNPSWRSLLRPEEMPWLATLKGQGENDMPAAAYILMAAEAARQTFVAAGRNEGYIVISDISFGHCLSLSSFGTMQNLELHLHCQPKEGANIFNFRILYLLSGLQDSSEQLCSGSFAWTEDFQPDVNCTVRQIGQDHDAWLLEQLQAVRNDSKSKLLDIRLDRKGSSGAFNDFSDPYDHCCIDLETLHSIFQLVCMSNFQHGLPSVQRIASIASLTLPVAERKGKMKGCFNIDTGPTNLSSIHANVKINFGDNYVVSIADIRLAHGKAIVQRPEPGSLFYKSVMLPDISRVEPRVESVCISECLRLVTHKWPMSDVALIGMTDEDTKTILDFFRGIDGRDGLHFRSTDVIGQREDHALSSKIRFADKLDNDRPYHLVFQGDDHFDLDEVKRLVLPDGLLCTCLAKEQQDSLSNAFMKLWDVTGLDEPQSWNFWRRLETYDLHKKPLSNSRLTVFGSSDQLSAFAKVFPGAETVVLEPGAMKSFLIRKETVGKRHNAIILDNVERPVIMGWLGRDLVPWFQLLLTGYENILWVTPNSFHLNPHHGVAGNLLRSLQAEQPSIRTAWLTFRDAKNPKMQENVCSAYRHLVSGHGDNEVLLEHSGSDSKILRYLPDDELSVSTGTRLPRNGVTSPLRGKNYEVSLATPISTTTAWNEHRKQGMDDGMVRVTIESSVIDLEDVLALKQEDGVWKLPPSCRFFAGRVDDSGSAEFGLGSQVVGWYEGPHCGQIYVPAASLYICKAFISFPASAAGFACLCVSLSIVDGAARARKGDVFDIRFAGPVAEATAEMCREFGAETLEPDAKAMATFTVDIAAGRGFVVNDTSVDIKEYLSSGRGIDLVHRCWKETERQTLTCKIVTLANIEGGFPQLGPQDIYSSVLDHSDRGSARGVTVKRSSGSLFTSEGTYILIGGLGGLGRFICSWMVENGARMLCVISRSGLQSQEARDTYAAIKASQASLAVIKADATDRVAIRSTLAQIRRTSRIKGVMNLAMVLEDSQFASMTGEQWDRAVGLKRDSSWILHEETSEDQLDFFVLLSSIASVLGNRGQGNYNIGNTFLNALADYRRSTGSTAVSIALGAMTEIGVLHDLGKEDLVQTLTRAGLSPLGKKELAKIMEAAIMESRHSERSLILTGLEMFDRVDGNLVGSRDQMQLFWTELPEFSFLQDHKLGDTETRTDDTKLSLRERVMSRQEEEAQTLLGEAFIEFLSQLLGFNVAKLETTSSLNAYGLDSLSAVSCQYWIHRNLSVDISINRIFDAPSIADLVKEIWDEVRVHTANDKAA